ncbi:MAG TPA: hypothetical protein VH186_29600, partial [Chloroflexia bacterium]|nr:hypothetical protein [Chloroflexia bacterium]
EWVPEPEKLYKQPSLKPLNSLPLKMLAPTSNIVVMLNWFFYFVMCCKLYWPWEFTPGGDRPDMASCICLVVAVPSAILPEWLWRRARG